MLLYINRAVYVLHMLSYILAYAIFSFSMKILLWYNKKRGTTYLSGETCISICMRQVYECVHHRKWNKFPVTRLPFYDEKIRIVHHPRFMNVGI